MDYKKIFIEKIIEKKYFVSEYLLNTYKVYFCIKDFNYEDNFKVNVNTYVLLLKYSMNGNKMCSIYKIEDDNVSGYLMAVNDINLDMYFISLRKKKIKKLLFNGKYRN